jgi:MFS family permease
VLFRDDRPAKSGGHREIVGLIAAKEPCGGYGESLAQCLPCKRMQVVSDWQPENHLPGRNCSPIIRRNILPFTSARKTTGAQSERVSGSPTLHARSDEGHQDGAIEGMAESVNESDGCEVQRLTDGGGETGEPGGPFAPLSLPTYRMFWIASLFSNTGTWIHEIGAGWLMSTLDGSPQMVSAVRAATALPIVLLAVPAGALSDRIDRRKMMLVVQCWLMAIAGTAAVLTYLQWITPVGLLILTVLMGLGVVLHVPTWQASIPEIVSRKHLPQAIALGSVSFNLARSVGPAVGGLLIAAIGTWAAFGANALSFGVVFLAVFFWKRIRVTAAPSDTFFQSMRAGVVLVTSRGEMRRVLVRVGVFVLPASSLWALMPLIARGQLAWDARGYGYLVGAIGLGAVLAAVWLPRMRTRLGVELTLVFTMATYALGLAIMAATQDRALAIFAAVAMGTGWMAVLTTLNATAQMALPDEMRARGMSCYLSTMAMAMAAGSMAWGKVAALQTPAFALAAASATLFAVCVATLFWPKNKVDNHLAQANT